MERATPPATFAHLLRRHRQAAGLTQEELAERARLSFRAVSDLERGARLAPRKDTVALLAEALALSPPDRAAFEAAVRRVVPLGEVEAPASGSKPVDAPGPDIAPIAAALPSGVLTFLIADVRGYTAFTHQHGDAAGARLATHFATLAGEAMAVYGGQVVEVRGDEVLAVFTSARNALRAAVDLLARCTATTTADLPMHVGVGLDVGEPIPVPGGYRGEVINVAARLCARAGPGEVLASDAVVSLARRVEGLAYEEHGPLELKGLLRPVRAWLVRAEESTTAEAPDESGAANPGTSDGGLPSAAPRPVGWYLGAVPDTVLVDREPERGRLLAVLDAVARGHGRLLLLAGEPGVGKTRLAQEVMLQAAGRGFHVLVGRCYEQYASQPFFPFVEALTTALSLATPVLRQEIPRRFSYLGRLLPDLLASLPQADGQDARLRVLWAVGGFLAALAAEAPLALLLDDLHWADSASLELLLYLARQAPATTCWCLARTAMWRSTASILWRPPSVTCYARMVEEVTLRGLPLDDTAALIGAHFGLQRSRGTARLVRAHRRQPILHRGSAQGPGGARALSPSGQRGWDHEEGAEMDVPRSIRSVVGRGWDGCRRRRPGGAAGCPACWGWSGTWMSCGGSRSGRGSAAGTWMHPGATLLEERPAGRRERYAFAHALVGQALYEEIPRHRLRKLHLRAGEALERQSGSPPGCGRTGAALPGSRRR